MNNDTFHAKINNYKHTKILKKKKKSKNRKICDAEYFGCFKNTRLQFHSQIESFSIITHRTQCTCAVHSNNNSNKAMKASEKESGITSDRVNLCSRSAFLRSKFNTCCDLCIDKYYFYFHQLLSYICSMAFCVFSIFQRF